MNPHHNVNLVRVRWPPHANAQPISPGQKVFAWRDCQSCCGRGWFLINPFAAGGTNGVGGIENMTQCRTCLSHSTKVQE